MSRRPTFPLGIDIGAHRVRVALSAPDGDGEPRLVAVATRDRDGDATAALASALAELNAPERRCVIALDPADAVLHSVQLPPMPSWERARAARYEAARFIDYPIADAAISLSPAAPPLEWTVGIARRAALSHALRTLRELRLRAIAVDEFSLALRRAQPQATSAIDVGGTETRVVFFGPALPAIARIPIGGDHLTAAIARSLGTDTATAEHRKRHTGFAGAGEAERDLLIAAIADALAAPAHERDGVQRVVLCGNGSRIPGFDRALAQATGLDVAAAALAQRASDTVPADVLRAAGADWSVAYGLSLWSAAA